MTECMHCRTPWLGACTYSLCFRSADLPGLFFCLPFPCVDRDAFTAALDTYWSILISALYFLYLNLVKGALSVFDCSKNDDGVLILDADPSIHCNEVGAMCDRVVHALQTHPLSLRAPVP